MSGSTQRLTIPSKIECRGINNPNSVFLIGKKIQTSFDDSVFDFNLIHISHTLSKKQLYIKVNRY